MVVECVSLCQGLELQLRGTTAQTTIGTIAAVLRTRVAHRVRIRTRDVSGAGKGRLSTEASVSPTMAMGVPALEVVMKTTTRIGAVGT